MSRRIQIRRGTAAELALITPAQGELCWTTDTKKLYSGDSTTAGGVAIGLGTVTATGGSLTSNRLALGAGSNDLKTTAGLFTDGASKLTLGLAGTSVGGLLLANATSGTIELRPVTGALGTTVILFPAVSDTVVLLTAAQTLTTKTLTSPILTAPAIDYGVFTNAAAPATPAAGKVIIYAKTDKLLYSKDDAGVETLVSGGVGGGGGGSGDMLLGTAQTVTAAKTFNAGTLKMTTAGNIVDSNGNELIQFPSTVSSAVNEFTITNAATGANPILSASGTDTNIGFTLKTKGSGQFRFLANNTESMQLNIETVSVGSESAILCLKLNGTSQAFISSPGTSGGQVTGSSVGDLVLRTQGTNITLTTDSGTSICAQFVASTGQLTLLKNITSTSSTTGTLKVTGGVGISENLNVAGSSNTFSNTTDATSYTAAAVMFSGGIAVAKKSYLGTGAFFGTATPSSITSNNSGSLTLASAGTNQDINLNPIGSGQVRVLSPASNSVSMTLDTTDATGVNNILNLKFAATVKAQIGLAGGAGYFIGDTALSDLCIRSQGFDIRFSTDSGTSTGFQVVASNGGIKTNSPGGSGAGAWKLGTRTSGSYTADLTKAVEVSIGGTLIRLAVLT